MHLREIRLKRFSPKLFADLGSPAEYTQDLIFQSTVSSTLYVQGPIFIKFSSIDSAEHLMQ